MKKNEKKAQKIIDSENQNMSKLKMIAMSGLGRPEHTKFTLGENQQPGKRESIPIKIENDSNDDKPR